MKMNRKYIGCFICIISLFIMACAEKETDYMFPEPQILSASNESSLEVVQEPGKVVRAEIKLQAASGLASLTVLQGETVFDDVVYTHDELSAEYSFEFRIPEDATLGTNYLFNLTLIDGTGNSRTFSLTVTVDATYTIEEEVVGGRSVKVISGTINGDFHIEKGETYVVNGTVAVEDNGRLTIDQGNTIYFRTSDNNDLNSRLVITRGSSIQAVGTADEPIVFTSEKLLRGEEVSFDDWGGIFVYGRAPGNRGANVVEDGFAYGGDIPTENSGRLRYIRIEYAGKDEYHGLNLFGVGSGTIVDHIQVFYGQNNAFRIRGGRVNLRYITAIDHGGYGLWADEGWQGKGQFWLFQTDIPASLVPINFWNQARSLELRSHASFYDTEPRTTFQISNVTLIGNGSTSDAGTRRGARVRQGAVGQLRNVIVAHFASDAVRVEDLPLETLGDDMILDNIRAFNSATNYAQEAESFFFESGQFDVTEQVVNGISMDNYVGSATSPFNPQSLDPWFISASYIGAVQSAANDWTKEGNWFRNRGE